MEAGKLGRDPSEGPAEGLPLRRRGYDTAATDALIGQLIREKDELEREGAALRQRMALLEADVARGREREQQVSKALAVATRQAFEIKENAEHEAEQILRAVRAESEKWSDAAARIAREQEDAERELQRLRRIQHAVQTGLAGFLTEAVEKLRAEEADEMLELPAEVGGNALVDEHRVAPEASTPG